MATIEDKSRTKEIITRLQGIINNASPVPLASGIVTVHKDEVLTLLTELEQHMDVEIKTYHEVNDRKGKILNEAKRDAERIIYEAEQTASRMRVSKRATRVAPLNYDMLDEEERNALGGANEIYAASLIYTDEMLTEVTDLIKEAYDNIFGDYQIILEALHDKLSVLSNNRQELMVELQDMEMEDRGQQILEIGKLLSSELYHERMKKRMNPDEYEDGSMQPSQELNEEQVRMAEEQESRAKYAEEQAMLATQALEEMKAERDALMATVEKLKRDGLGQVIRDERSGSSLRMRKWAAREQQPAGGSHEPVLQQGQVESVMQEPVQYQAEPVAQEPEAQSIVQTQGTNALQEEEEYEIVYVTEDELAEGEEYEIEYVDEEPGEEEEYEIVYVTEDELAEGEEYEIEYVDEEPGVEEAYGTGLGGTGQTAPGVESTAIHNAVQSSETADPMDKQDTVKNAAVQPVEEKAKTARVSVKKAARRAVGMPAAAKNGIEAVAAEGQSGDVQYEMKLEHSGLETKAESKAAASMLQAEGSESDGAIEQKKPESDRAIEQKKPEAPERGGAIEQKKPEEPESGGAIEQKKPEEPESGGAIEQKKPEEPESGGTIEQKKPEGNLPPDQKQRGIESKEAAAAGTKEGSSETLPIESHLKQHLAVASAPSGKVAGMAKAMTTEKKYVGLILHAVREREKKALDERPAGKGGLIRRAVQAREKAEADISVYEPESEDREKHLQDFMAGRKMEKDRTDPSEEKSKAADSNLTKTSSKAAGADTTEETPKKKESDSPKEKPKAVEEKRSGDEKTGISAAKSGAAQSGTDPAKTSASEKQTGLPAGKQNAASDGADNKPELDEDIRIDADGNKYVQASMQFDEEFEIMEFD